MVPSSRFLRDSEMCSEGAMEETAQKPHPSEGGNTEALACGASSESLENEGEGQAYPRLTRTSTLRSEGRGIAKELTRGLLGGVPHPSSRGGADICVLEGGEARPGSGHGVGKLWLLLWALFMFVRWSFPRKVPCQSSKFGLADGRVKGTCPCLCGKPRSEAGVGRGGSVPEDNFLGPLA